MVLEFFGGIDAFDDMVAALKMRIDKRVLDSSDVSKVLFAATSLVDYTGGVLALNRSRNSEEEEADHVWRRFSMVSHELYNSIALLRALGERAERTQSGGRIEDLSEAWQRVLLRLDELQRFRLNRLTFQLKYKLRRQKVPLPSLVKAAVACIPEEKVTLQGECQVFYGDEIQLSSIFENIALNASYAIREHGELVVHISDDKEMDGVRITFANTGPEIPEETIDRIFEFGFTTRPDGHGVGLAIVRDLVQLHEGTIQVHSSPRETVFEIFLPRTQ